MKKINNKYKKCYWSFGSNEIERAQERNAVEFNSGFEKRFEL